MMYSIKVVVCFGVLLFFALADTSFENEYELREAIQQERINTIRRLITKRVDINHKYGDGQRPIHVAVKNGDLNIVRLIADSGADLNSQDSDGYTPLHLAVLRDKSNIVKTLVGKNVDLNIKDNIGRTPLDISIELGQKSTTEYLVEHDADVNPNLEEWEQLALGCALSVNSEAIGKLMKKGVTLKFKWQDTFEKMIIQGNVNATKTIIKMCGVNLENKRGPFPLHLAAEHDQDEIAIILIEHGANVDGKNKAGITPLFNAKLKVAKILLEHGAKVNAKNANNETPLIIAAQKGEDKMVELLIRYAANVNERNKDNHTPLHLAAHNEKLVEILIRNGADVDAKDGSGRTPLFFAIMNGHSKTVEIFLRNGANPNLQDNNGDNPLEIAMRQSKSLEGYDGIIKHLMDHGAQTFNGNDTKKISTSSSPRTPPIPVEILLPDGNTFPLGSNATLLCNVGSSEKLHIYWSKDGHSLFPDSRIKVSDNNTLTIYGVQNNDAARYKCNAAIHGDTYFDEKQILVSVEAECRWTGCHLHSAGDWCDVFGPGWHVKNWQRCNGIFGKQEYCCTD